MEVNYIADKKVIEIKDNEKPSVILIGTMMLLTLTNAILFPLANPEDSLNYLWAIIGIGCLIMLAYLLLKSSIANHISLEKIQYLKERKVFGESSLRIKLKNGRNRDLAYIKDPAILEELKTMFSEWGVKVV